MTTRITLRRRTGEELTALVDDEDAKLVAAHHWCAAANRWGGCYAVAHIYVDGRRTSLYMHKLITGFKRTDHINRNGLDNRRENLRDVTHAQNVVNSPARRGAASSYRGVRPYKGSWRAGIKVDGVQRHLGTFSTERDAARAYDAAAFHTWGEHAYINLPADLDRHPEHYEEHKRGEF